MEQDEKYTIFIPLLLAIIFQGISAIKRIDLPVRHHELHGSNDVRTATQTAKILYQTETNLPSYTENIQYLPQTKKLMHARENAANRNGNQFLKKSTAGSKELLWLINYFPLNEQFVNYPHADFSNRENEYEYFYNNVQDRGFEDGYSYYNGDEVYGDANYPDDEQHQYSDFDMQDDKKVLENIHHFVLEIPQKVFNESYKATKTDKPTASMGNILYPLYADTHNKNLLLGYMHHRIITDPRILNMQSAVSKQGHSLFNRNYTQIYKDIKDGMVVNHKEHPIYMEIGNKKIFIGYLHHIILNATIGSLLKFNQNQEDNIHSMYTNYEKMFADNNINRPVYSNGNSPYVATMSHVIIPFYGIKNQNRFHAPQEVIQDTRFGVTYFPFREMSAHHGMYYGHSKIGYEEPFSRWPLYNTRVVVYTQRPIMDGNWMERSLGNVRGWISQKMLNYIKEMGINMYRQKSGNIFGVYPNYHPKKYWYQESKISEGYPHYTAVIMHFYIPLEYMPMGNEKRIAKYRYLWQKLMNRLEQENQNENSNKPLFPGEVTEAESTTLEVIQTDLNKKPTINYYEKIFEMTTKETPEIKEETWITAKPNGFSETAEAVINTEREMQTPAEEQKTVIFRTKEPEWRTVIFRTKEPEWKIFRTEEPKRFSKETPWVLDERKKEKKEPSEFTNEATSGTIETTTEEMQKTDFWSTDKQIVWDFGEREEKDKTKQSPKDTNQPTSEKSEIPSDERWGIEDWGNTEAWDHGERYNEKDESKKFPKVTNEPTSERTETTVENEWRTNVWNREEPGMSSKETWYKEREKENTKITELPKLTNQPTSEKSGSSSDERWGIEDWDTEAWDHGERYDEKEETTKTFPEMTNEPTFERTETTAGNEWRTNVWDREELGMSSKETWYKEREKEKTKMTELPKLTNQPTSEKSEIPSDKRLEIEEWNTEAWDHGETYDEKEETTKKFPEVTNEPTSEGTETTVENRWRTNVWNREEPEMSSKETWYKEREKENTKITELPKLTNQPTSEKSGSSSDERWGIKDWDTEAWDHHERYDEKEETTKTFPKVTNEPSSERTETTVENEWRTNVWNREEPEMSSKETWYKEREKENTKITELPKLTNQPSSETSGLPSDERGGSEEWSTGAWDHRERYDEKEEMTKTFPEVTNEPTSEDTQTTVENRWRTNVWNREEPEMSSKETWYKEREKENTKITELPKLTNQPSSETSGLPSNERWGSKEWSTGAWDHGERYDEKEEMTKKFPEMTNEPTLERTETTAGNEWRTNVWNREEPGMSSKEIEEWDKGAWDHGERYDEKEETTKNVPEETNEPTVRTEKTTEEGWRIRKWSSEEPGIFSENPLWDQGERVEGKDETTKRYNEMSSYQPSSELPAEQSRITNLWRTEQPEMFNREPFRSDGKRKENENEVIERYHDTTSKPPSKETKPSAEEMWITDMWTTKEPETFSKKSTWDYGEKIEGKEETSKSFPKFTNEESSERIHISTEEEQKMNLWTTESLGIFNKNTLLDHNKRIEEKGEATETYYEIITEPTSKRTEMPANQEWRTQAWSSKEPGMFSRETWGNSGTEEEIDKTTKKFSAVTNKPSSEKPETHDEQELKTKVWNTEEPEMFNKVTLWEHNEQVEEKSKTSKKYSEVTNEPTSEKTQSDERWRTQEWGRELASTETLWNYGENVEKKDKTSKNYETTDVLPSERTEAPTNKEWNTKQPEMFSRKTMWGYGEREDLNEETRTNFDTTNEFTSEIRNELTSERTGKLLEKTSPSVAKNSTVLPLLHFGTVSESQHETKSSTEGSFEVIKEQPNIFSHNTQVTTKETLVTKPVLNEETGATEYGALDKSHNIYHETTTSESVETVSVPNGKLWQSNEYDLIIKNNSKTGNVDADIYGQRYYQIHLLYYPFRNKYGVSYLPYSEQFMLWWNKNYGNHKNNMNKTSYFDYQSWLNRWNRNPNINRTERNNSINWNDGMHFTWNSSSIRNREYTQSLYYLAHYIYYPIKQGSTIWYHRYSEVSQKWNYYLYNKQNNNGPNENDYHHQIPGSSFTNGTRFLYDIPEQKYVNEKFRFNASRYYPFKYGSTIFYRGHLYHDNLHNAHNAPSGVDNSFVATDRILYYPIKRGETIWYYNYVPLYHKSSNAEARISKYQKYIYYPLKKGSKIWYYNYITYSNSDLRSHISKYQNYIYYPLMRGSTLWYYTYVMLQNDRIYNNMAYSQRYNSSAHETNNDVFNGFNNNGTWRNRFQPGINKTSYVNGFEIGNNGASGSGPHDVFTQQTIKWKIGQPKGNVTHGFAAIVTSGSSNLYSRYMAYYPYKDGRNVLFQPLNSHQGTASRLHDQNENHNQAQLNIDNNGVEGEPAHYIYIYSTGKPYSKVWNQSLHYAYYPIQNSPVVEFCPFQMYYSKFLYTGLRFSLHSSAASTNSHIQIGVKKTNDGTANSNYSPREKIRPHNPQWSKTRRLPGLNLHYYPYITEASVYYVKMVPYSKSHFKQNGSFSKYYLSNMNSDQVHHETEPNSNTNQIGTSYSHSSWSYSQQTNSVDSLFNKFYYYRHGANETVITTNRTIVNSGPVHNYTGWKTEHQSTSYSVPVSPQSSSWKMSYHYKIFPNGTKYLVSSGRDYYSRHQASTIIRHNNTHGQTQFFPDGAQHYSDGSKQYYYGQPSSTLQNSSHWQSYRFPSTNHTYGTSNKISYHYKIFPNGTKYLVSSGGNYNSGHQASTHGQTQIFPDGAQHYSVGSKQYHYGQPSSTLQNSSYWQSYRFPSTNHTYGTSNKISYHYKIFPNGTKYIISSGGNYNSGHQASTHGQTQIFPDGAQHYSVGSKQYHYGQPSSTLQNSSYWQSYRFPSTNHTYGTSNKISYHYKIFPNGTKYLISSGGNYNSGHQASTHGQTQIFPDGAQHYSVGSKQYHYGQPSSTLQNSSYWQSYRFPSTNHTYGTSNKISYHYKIFPNGTKYLISSGGNYNSGHQASTHGQTQIFPDGAQHYSVGSKQYHYGQPSSTLQNSSYWQSYRFPSTNHTYGTSNKISYHYKIFPNGTKYLVSSGGNYNSGHQASTHGQTQIFPDGAQHYSVGSKQYHYGQHSSTLQNSSYWQSYQFPSINHTYGTSNKSHYSSHHFSTPTLRNSSFWQTKMVPNGNHYTSKTYQGSYSPTLHNGTYFHSYQLPNGTQYYSSKSSSSSLNSNNSRYWHSATFHNNTHWQSQAIPIYSSQRITNVGSHSVSSHAFKPNRSNWQTNWSSSIQYSGQPYQVSHSRVQSSSYHYGPMNVSTVSRKSGAPEIKISQTVYNDGKSVPYSTHSVISRSQRSAPILETDLKNQNFTLSKDDFSASVYNITEELNSDDISGNGTTNSSSADYDLVSEENGNNYGNSVNSTIDYDLLGKPNTNNLLENTTYRQNNISGTSEEFNNTVVEEELSNDDNGTLFIDCNDTVSENSSDISSIANNNNVSKIDNETLPDISNNETSLYEDSKNDNLIGTSSSQIVNSTITERRNEDTKEETDLDKSAVQFIGEEETSGPEEGNAKKPIKFMLSVSMSLDTPEIIELSPVK